MKKTAFILTLCTLALVSCGKADVAEESSPLSIQKATVNTTATNEREEYKSPFMNNSSGDSEPQSTGLAEETTPDGSLTLPVTTVRTGSAVLVKRTGSANNIPSSRGDVVIPYASNVVRTSKTTAVKTTAAKKTTVVKTTAQTSTTVVTTAPENPADVTNGDITCRVLENGVEIIRGGKVVQLIEVDTEQMLSFYAEGVTDSSTLVNIGDFDFDGYDDLFIPQDIGANNTFGIYMHCNPETESFEYWQEMAEISVYGWTEDDYTFHTYAKDSAFENTTKVYVWNDEKQLVLTSSRVQYLLDDSTENIYADYFEYPDGEQILVKREKLLFDDNNEIIGTEEIPLDEEPTEPSTESPTEKPDEETEE